MARGNHTYVRRLGYTHHGIDCGNATGVHYTGDVGQTSDAVVPWTTIQVPEEDTDPDSAIRAPDPAVPYSTAPRNDWSSERSGSYHCAHFARWCNR
jgi:Lecithin retinol acyltransferase